MASMLAFLKRMLLLLQRQEMVAFGRAVEVVTLVVAADSVLAWHAPSLMHVGALLWYLLDTPRIAGLECILRAS